MRLFLLTGLLCCALSAQAQYNTGLFGSTAEEGSYILVDNIRVRYTGKLKIFTKELVVKEKGKTIHWHPDEVHSIRIGERRYTTARGFRTKSGFGSRVEENNVFVELLDSGKISLMRYDYSVGAPGSSSQLTAYLLKEADQDTAVTIPVSVYTGKGKRFRDALAPYVMKRPDLVKLLEDGSISIESLPALIHALNTNSPFIRPTRPGSTLSE
ncbi:hypothetical protein FNT36_05345 [Hymenobacter setariae]|uniref:Uncharacterized protein n=1 Tax=Hymenobacter setariae TaxID=2594794 RepID=A0A558C422_9BACT|nr:hypothetical protein [Hymenobacter setariae]TVT43514.1 hypothetical protein FNT36_05345 [Hymenobacter setariae]